MRPPRGWFNLADPTFAVSLYPSPDWRYTAPKWKTEESLQHQHAGPRGVLPNHHCAAVECLYYMTHGHPPPEANSMKFEKGSPWKEGLGLYVDTRTSAL